MDVDIGIASRVYRYESRPGVFVNPDQIILPRACNEGYVQSGPYKLPCTQLRSVAVYADGVQVGGTYYRGMDGTASYMKDPETGVITRVE